MFHGRAFLCLLALSIPLSISAKAESDPKVICAKKTTGALALRDRCRRDEDAITNRRELVGPAGQAGTAGAPGEDVAVKTYGDGSSGVLHVTNSGINGNLENPQYTDIIIDADAALNVDSGTILRATNSVVINGQIYVRWAAYGGKEHAQSLAYQSDTIPPNVQPNPGVGRTPAGIGEIGPSSRDLTGGWGGYEALNPRLLLHPGVYGGGGGGSGSVNTGPGGIGGGTLTILAGSYIEINGTIRFDVYYAGDGGGGGGGGVGIFAARSLIKQNGVIQAEGGSGSNGASNIGPGGGGGGGIIHFLTPALFPTTGGTLLLSGGWPGAQKPPGSITAPWRRGGSGGGASGGSGGFGGDVNTDGSSTAATAGGDGKFIWTQIDPSYVF